MTLVSNPETEKPRRSQTPLETQFSWDRLDSVLLDCAQMLEHSPVAPQPAKQAAGDAAFTPPSLAEKPAQAVAPARLSQAAGLQAAQPPSGELEKSTPQTPGWRPIADEREMEKAARLVKSILASPQPAQAVAEKLEDIDRLLPALLELNIRQALNDGRPDLAKSLTALARKEPTNFNARPVTTAQKSVILPGGQKPLRVLFWSGNHANIVQQTIPAGALADRG
ncbi:MAG TPA: hypothetical protein VLS48_05535, partial [Anaerolineales bacterium]|nr:hypothetical protein [Anaerolineales bacterium]